MAGKNAELIYLIWMLVVGLVAEVRSVEGDESCAFPAVFNFGDSNSATGAKFQQSEAVAAAVGHPVERQCDGLLIIDYIAESLKLPHLSAFQAGTNFQHGANFARGGATITPPSFGGGMLSLQIDNFLRFKAKAIEINKNKTTTEKNITVPKFFYFGKALYTLDIGQNDLAERFGEFTPEQIKEQIPGVLNQFAQGVVLLYKEGARFFWVHNTGPIGCLPYVRFFSGAKLDDVDEYGCLNVQNDLAKEFNKQLNSTISWLRTKLPVARITQVDVYTIKYELISHQQSQGFMDPLLFCCAVFPAGPANCKEKTMVNGIAYGSACKDRSKRISWDAVHYTEAANKWVASRVINGSYSNPPLSIQNACRRP